MNGTELEQLPNDPRSFRSGYVVIIGEPNVGKSTLLNTLIGQKISIVTQKPQTTRHKILGILTGEEYQIIFLDTPGLLKPRYKLHEAMMKAATSALDDADVVLFMIDLFSARSNTPDKHALPLSILERSKKSAYLVINKIDLGSAEEVRNVLSRYSSDAQYKNVFPISALTKEGTEPLLKSIINDIPYHPPYYPSDFLSEQSERFFVSEIIREKIFESFREEIPYSTTVDIIEFKEQESKKDVIQAEIYVERDSQKAILIGKHGSALRSIGSKARKDIERLLDREVFLQLYVKVRGKWREDESWLKRLGYIKE